MAALVGQLSFHPITGDNLLHVLCHVAWVRVRVGRAQRVPITSQLATADADDEDQCNGRYFSCANDDIVCCAFFQLFIQVVWYWNFSSVQYICTSFKQHPVHLHISLQHWLNFSTNGSCLLL